MHHCPFWGSTIHAYLDVQVPGVVLIVSQVDPLVEGDHPLVQGQDRLVAGSHPANLDRRVLKDFINPNCEYLFHGNS